VARLVSSLKRHVLVDVGVPGRVVPVIGWILALLATAVPGYMIWSYANRAATLERRIADCDLSLLEDDGLRISRLMAAPEGTLYIENAQVVLAPTLPEPVLAQSGDPYSNK